MRRTTRVVEVGGIPIGGNNPVVVQSMTKTKTRDIKATVAQIQRLQQARCEMVRVAVVNSSDAEALASIKKSISIPLIADIHFDYRLALKAIDAGVDKVRINPGTLRDRNKLVTIITKARDHNIPMRIGVNTGSLPARVMRAYRHPTPKAIVETVYAAIELFKKQKFSALVISAKAAGVLDTISAYRAISNHVDYPLHLGITEAGLPFRGGIKSAVGMGILLHEGIGDTIRVSLTGDPVLEVIAAYDILSALGLRSYSPMLISCPMCGRCEVDLEKIARAVERRLTRYRTPMKVAVMGCVVNGPGEAREADFGIACGKQMGMIFAKGKEIKRVREAKLINTLFEVIDANINN